MSGIKLLFLAIWDEFLTLIFLRALFEENVESQSNHYRANDVGNNMAGSASRSSEPSVSNYKKNHPYQKWHQTQNGRDRFMRRIVEIFAIVAVLVYLLQMQANRRQADAAESQLREMHEENILAERAWISTTTIDFNFVVPPGDVQATINFKNTGKTPAMNVLPIGIYSFDRKHIPDMDNRQGLTNYSGMVGPDVQTKTTDWSFVIPSEAVKAITNGVSFYIYGTIWYDDIFGSNHWSQFCYQINTNFHSWLTPFHNSCDDEKSSNRKK
jgi:hypothetical protein